MSTEFPSGDEPTPGGMPASEARRLAGEQSVSPASGAGTQSGPPYTGLASAAAGKPQPPAPLPPQPWGAAPAAPQGPAVRPPPPPPSRRGGGWKTGLIIVLVILLGGSLLLNVIIGVVAGGFGSSDPNTVQTVIQRGSSGQKIAVIPVEGIITGQTVGSVGSWIDSVERDQDVKAVILVVDTPGGGVTASDVLYNKLLRMRNNRQIPVIVSMGGMATSGGYYVSAPATYIFAQPTTLTGNIGVLMPRYNVSELAKKWGIAENTISAPRDGMKNAGSMFNPEAPKETAYFQGLIDDMYKRFSGIVYQHRQGKLRGNIEQIADGRVYTATEAKANGLIDDIGYFEDALAYATRAAGLSNPTVVRYSRRMSFLDALGMEGKAGAGPVNVHLKIDADTINELSSPKPMYLWRGE